MSEIWIPIIIVPVLFIALPWLILHYITKWKVNSGLTAEDENLLDDLYDLSRRLDERMATIERIMQDEQPGWSTLGAERAAPRLGAPEVRDLPRRRQSAPDLVKHGRR